MFISLTFNLSEISVHPKQLTDFSFNVYDVESGLSIGTLETKEKLDLSSDSTFNAHVTLHLDDWGPDSGLASFLDCLFDIDECEVGNFGNEC